MTSTRKSQAQVLIALALKIAPRERMTWFRAMAAEIDHIPEAKQRSFAAGCCLAATRERVLLPEFLHATVRSLLVGGALFWAALNIRFAGRMSVIDAFAVEGLDAAAPELTVTLAFNAPGFAIRAGQRLLVKPFVFPDIDPTDWAAETRSVDIDLGDPYVREESVVFKLPDGTASARHPAPATMNAGDAGSYDTSFSGKGNVILCSRKLRISTSRFPAANWAPLRKWFLDMATNDDQPIVIELREGS